MAESTGLLNLRGGNLSEGSNPSLSAILFFSPLSFSQSKWIFFMLSRSWATGGVSAAPRTPCVRQGAGAGYGSAVWPGSAARAGRWNESRGNTRGLPAFLRKDPIAFPLPFAGCRASADSRGNVAPRSMSKLQRYGERRDTPCRFLSPEPLSCRPFAVPLIADKSCIACRFLTVYGNSAGSAASGIPVTALRSHGHKRGQRRERNSRNGTAFSRAQAQAAPRAEFP